MNLNPLTKELLDKMVDLGLVSEINMKTALQYFERHQIHPFKLLLENGFIKEDEFLTVMTGAVLTDDRPPMLSLPEEIPFDLRLAIPLRIARRCNAVVFSKVDETYHVAMIEPYNQSVINDLKFLLKAEIEPHLISWLKIKECFGNECSESEKAEQPLAQESMNVDNLPMVINAEGSNKFLGVPGICLDDFELNPDLIRLIPFEIIEKFFCLPISRSPNNLIVAFLEPNEQAKEDIQFITGYHVEMVTASKADLQKKIEEMRLEREMEYRDEELFDISPTLIQYGAEDEECGAGGDDLLFNPGEEPVVQMVNLILVDAIKKKATEVHVEIYDKSFRIRYRLGGILYEVMKPPMRLKDAIIARLKIMSDLDLIKKNSPLSGRMVLRIGRGKEVVFLVSTLPTPFGEKVVLKISDNNDWNVRLENLGFQPDQLAMLLKACERNGLVLITGGLSSGKKVTLRELLSQLVNAETNIVTIEDPIEQAFRGVSQVKVSKNFGRLAAFEAALIQNPDIIIIDRLDEPEIAKRAVQAASDGHLVISTLSADDAVSAIYKLIYLGVNKNLLVNALRIVTCERSVRTICFDCKDEQEKEDVVRQELRQLGFERMAIDSLTICQGRGCRSCNNLGNRVEGKAIFEVAQIGDEVRSQILQDKSPKEIRQYLIDQGMVTMKEVALELLKSGDISLAEAIRVASD